MVWLKKSLLIIGLVGAGLLLGQGCPRRAPDYLPFFIASPTSLDFGTDKVALTLEISKNYTSQPLPTFTVQSDGASWISVSPPTGNSTGPKDPASFTVTVDRSMLAAGTNTGSVSVTAPGVTPLSVPVTATARISADFEGDPQVVSVGQMVQFTDLSAVAPGEAPISQWQWDFGDGNTSNLPNPQWIYASDGAYNVTLTVSNGVLSDTEFKLGYITVEGPLPPTADFVASTTTPVAGELVQFTDLSSPGSDAINAWLWDFGDGGSSMMQSPSHTYNQVANFTVSLMVTTGVGSDTATKTNYIHVQPVGPTADFTASTQNPAVGQIVTFTDMSNPGSSPITTWIWDFGDGSESMLQNPGKIYAAVGAYTVYLTVTTSIGSDTETKVNYINVHAKKKLQELGGLQ